MRYSSRCPPRPGGRRLRPGEGRRAPWVRAARGVRGSIAPVHEIDVAVEGGPGRRLVLVTLPGHGPPEGRSAGVRLPFEAAAAAVAAAVEAAAGPEPATWLGYSLGGRLALRVALDRPDLVEALVLLGATAGIEDPAARAARVEIDERLASGLERRGVERFVDGWLAQDLFARLPRAAAGVDERRRGTVEGLASALRLLGTGA